MQPCEGLRVRVRWYVKTGTPSRPFVIAVFMNSNLHDKVAGQGQLGMANKLGSSFHAWWAHLGSNWADLVVPFYSSSSCLRVVGVAS